MIHIKLLKIKDSYVFDSKRTKGSHWYFVGNNKKDGMYLRGVTHLYIPDKKRFNQVNQGILVKARVKSFATPQGVKTNIITSDSNGNKFNEFDIKKNTVESKGNSIWRKIK